ncbi:MAG: TolC family protein [Pseudomonadota bacterium]
MTQFYECLRLALFRRAMPIGASLLVLFSSASAETMNQAVQRSLANSNARQVAIKSIEAQNSQVAISQGDRRATVDLFGEVAVESVDDGTIPGGGSNEETQLARQAALGVRYPVADGFRSLNQLYRDATLLDAEIIRLSDATETIALNAVQAYIDVFRHTNIVNISEQNISVHVEIARQVERAVDVGRLSEPDRFQANDKLLAARIAHADAKAALNDAISRYEFVIGSAPRGGLAVPALRNVPTSRQSIEETAVRNSFLLRVAQKDIDALTLQESIDVADWQPQVDVFLRGSVETDVDGATGTETNVAAGISLNWTLYKGGTRDDVIARNRDLTMRAHYRKHQIEDEVRDLARRSFNAYVAAVERKQLLDSTVLNNEKIVEAFKSEFEAAKRPLLEVLDAERALFNLKVRRTNAEAAVAYQQYRMLAAQSLLSRHFGLSPFGRNLSADFAARVQAEPREDFDISAPALE